MDVSALHRVPFPVPTVHLHNFTIKPQQKLDVFPGEEKVLQSLPNILGANNREQDTNPQTSKPNKTLLSNPWFESKRK